MNKDVLGVDIGGVIIAGTDEHKDTFFKKNHLETPAVEGAFTGLQKLVNEKFGEQVYLISKGGEHTAAKTREWLTHHKFYEKTRVKEENVHFCKKRSDKSTLCTQFSVTHFIDDLLEVLGYLYGAGIRNLYLLNSNPLEVERHARYVRHVNTPGTWESAVEMILRS